MVAASKLSLDDLRDVAAKLDSIGALRSESGSFQVVMNPSVLADLVAMLARERWKAEWRRQRLLRKGIIGLNHVRGEIGHFQGILIHGQA